MNKSNSTRSNEGTHGYEFDALRFYSSYPLVPGQTNIVNSEHKTTRQVEYSRTGTLY
ncbi:MAG: hypothetical protein ACI4KA_05705 [Oscillospiraceae bacterium]